MCASRVELNGSKNESSYRSCLVSYLAFTGPGRRIEDVAVDGARETFGLAHRFTRCYGGETPGSMDEPACFDDACPGSDTVNIVRARPVGPRAGSVPLVLELLDLLHIQLRCLAGETILRGAVLTDGLRLEPGPRRRPFRTRAGQGP